jgi:cellobiose phosphorylase
MMETILEKKDLEKTFHFLDSEKIPLVKIENKNGLAFHFHPNGNLFCIKKGDLLINQSLGCPLAGSLTRLYLRDLKGGQSSLLNQSPGAVEFARTENGVEWSGNFKEVEFVCSLHLSETENFWKWAIEVKNVSSKQAELDLFLAQDFGLAHQGAVRTNEAYTSHYLDHFALEDSDLGWLVCSRQTQAQGEGSFPWALTGCLEGASSYCTDGRDFYGNEFRMDRKPMALEQESLTNRVLQYEMAMAGIQNKPVLLAPDQKEQFHFFTYFVEDHDQPSSSKDLHYVGEVKKIIKDFVPASVVGRVDFAKNAYQTSEFLNGMELTDSEVRDLYPLDWKQEERNNQGLLSFFYRDSRHIVLPRKEVSVDRPHANMLATFGEEMMPNESAMCSTNYIYGLFNAQITCGTKRPPAMLSFVRNPYDILPSSGQRIFVQSKGGWHLLGMPSLYECGLNHSTWLYKFEDGIIEVKSYAKMKEASVYMKILCHGEPRAFAISHQVAFGGNEMDACGTISLNQDQICFQEKGRNHPDYFLKVYHPDKVARISDATWFGDKNSNYPFLVIETESVESFEMGFSGEAFKSDEAPESSEICQSSVNSFYQKNLLNFEITHQDKSVDKFNEIMPWYLHNALIHFISPHGIEQYKGGAWGVRDVSQGSVELLLATGQQALVKEVLKIVFSRQLLNRRDWPQWFSPGNVKFLQLHSHGDVVVWPLKALSDYIIATGDLEFLQEKVPYLEDELLELTEEKFTIAHHCKSVVDEIVDRFVGDTHLISYGEGDWNDSLQPANKTLKKRLVSSWTVELVYQTFSSFQEVCKKSGDENQALELDELCGKIKRDFNHYLIQENVVSGFSLFDESFTDCEPMLHPKDTKTGIHYRLLPMTRGMISEIFDPKQAEHHLNLIEEHLLFPDGAHLMNKPPKYQGGVETYFKRAESACNFGREIGLQYVHAHIRYAEAMAKLGKPDELLTALYTINPINIKEAVKNAELRQANLYFSSSDGDFANRYESYEKFDELKTGERSVKGGWRLYSSGPGLYINQVITRLLGIRWSWDHFILDPVIPKSLDGLNMSINFCAYPTQFVYKVESKGFSPSKVLVNGAPVKEFSLDANPYRSGGAKIPKDKFLSYFKNEDNLVEVIL